MNTGGVAGHGGGPTYQNHLFETGGEWPGPPEPDWEMGERRQHWEFRPHHYQREAGEPREAREAREAREWMMSGGRQWAGEPVYDQWRQPRPAYKEEHTRVSTTRYSADYKFGASCHITNVNCVSMLHASHVNSMILTILPRVNCHVSLCVMHEQLLTIPRA